MWSWRLRWNPVRSWLYKTWLGRKGRIEGKRFHPGPDDPKADTIEKIGDKASGGVKTISLMGQKRAERLEARCISAHKRLVRQQEQTATEVKRCDERIAKLDELKVERNHWPAWLGALVLLLIFAGEIAINDYAFQIQGGTGWQNMLLTVGISVVVVVLSHAVGREIVDRRALAKNEKASTEDTRLLWVLVVALLFIVGALAYLRQAYFEVVEAGNAFSSVQGFRGILLYILLQVAVVVGAIFVSVFTHDPYAADLRKKNRAQRRLERAQAKSERACAAEEANHRETKELVRSWLDYCREVASHYRAKNSYARKRSASRSDDPDVRLGTKVPDVLYRGFGGHLGDDTDSGFPRDPGDVDADDEFMTDWLREELVCCSKKLAPESAPITS